MKATIGPYQILGRLGSGAMGTVYHAWDPRLERAVAIKVLASNLAEDPKIVAYFEREGRNAAQMQHECIVGVYEIGRDGEDSYLVMEFVDGLDLAKLLAQAGKPPLPVAVLLMRDIALALEHAHEASRQIVHRDVKPANVMVRRDGAVKLTDFGLGRRLEGEMTLTLPGDVVGTAAYMSPEQAKGEPVGLAGDVFSAGIVGYQLLAGRRPFGGPDCGWEQMLALIRTRDPSPLESVDPEVPGGLARLVDSMLQKSAAMRPSMSGIARGFEEELAKLGVGTRRALVRDWAAPALPAERPVPKPAGSAEPARDRTRLGSINDAPGVPSIPADPTAVLPASPAAVASPAVASPPAVRAVAPPPAPRPAPPAPQSASAALQSRLILAVAGLLVLLGVLAWVLWRPRPKPKPPVVDTAALMVQVSPASARLSLDEVSWPPGQRIAGVAPGTHRIRVSDDPSRFVGFDSMLTLRAGQDTAFAVSLVPVAEPPPVKPDAARMFARADAIADPAKRIAALDEFLKVWPDHALARRGLYRKGYTEYEMGRYAAAAKSLHEVRRRWPASEEAATALELLRLPELH